MASHDISNDTLEIPVQDQFRIIYLRLLSLKLSFQYLKIIANDVQGFWSYMKSKCFDINYILKCIIWMCSVYDHLKAYNIQFYRDCNRTNTYGTDSLNMLTEQQYIRIFYCYNPIEMILQTYLQELSKKIPNKYTRYCQQRRQRYHLMLKRQGILYKEMPFPIITLPNAYGAISDIESSLHKALIDLKLVSIGNNYWKQFDLILRTLNDIYNDVFNTECNLLKHHMNCNTYECYTFRNDGYIYYSITIRTRCISDRISQAQKGYKELNEAQNTTNSPQQCKSRERDCCKFHTDYKGRRLEEYHTAVNSTQYDVSGNQTASPRYSLPGSSDQYDVIEYQDYSLITPSDSSAQYDLDSNQTQLCSQFRSYVPGISNQQDIYDKIHPPLQFQHMLVKRTSPWEMKDLDFNELKNFAIHTEKINRLYHLKVNNEDPDDKDWNMCCRMLYKGEMKFVRLFALFGTLSVEFVDLEGFIHITKIPEFFLSNMIPVDQTDSIQRYLVQDGYRVPKFDRQYKWPPKYWTNVPPLKFLCYNAIYNYRYPLPHIIKQLPPLLAKSVEDFITVKTWEKES